MEHSIASTNGEQDVAPAGALNSPSPARPAARRMLLVLLLPALVCLVAAGIFLKMFVAERLPELKDGDLEKSEALWERAGPAGYDMDLEIRGTRPGTVHVEVRNEEVVAMQRDGRAPPQHTWRYWSVPGLFETLERELTMAEDPEHEVGAKTGTQWTLRGEFDSTYGYPRRFHRYVSGGGPEVYWNVKSFAPK